MTICNSACIDTQVDALNCGACGHACQGGTCIAGACQTVTLASSQGGVGELAIDLTEAFWTSDSTVKKVALTGGSVATLAAYNNSVTIRSISVAGGVVVYSFGGSGFWEVAKVSSLVQSPTTLASIPDAIAGVVVAGSDAYWSSSVLKGGLNRVPLAGGTPSRVDNSVLGGLTADVNFVYYWNGNLGSTGVWKASLATGATTFLASPQVAGQLRSITRAGSYVYWTDGSSNVHRVGTGGGGSGTLIASGQSSPTMIAADATHVYWTNRGNGTVMRVAIAGGAPQVFASGLSQPYGIAVDTVSVYWTELNSGDGRIVKLAK